MFNNNNRRPVNSPRDLRDDNNETLETYHPSPRVLVRQNRIGPERDSDSVVSLVDNKQQSGDKRQQQQQQQSKWLSRFHSSSSSTTTTAASHQHPKSLRDRLTQKIARLSSLDSTRSSSSIEVDPNDVNQSQHHQSVMPLISITSNEPTTTSGGFDRVVSPIQTQRRQFNNYYGRSRIGLAHDGHHHNNKRNNHDFDDDDEEDEDEFDDPPLSIPYSSSSMSRCTIVRQQTDNGITSYPSASVSTNNNAAAPVNTFANSTTNYEDLLDDRQGMNSSEQQFTKGEKLNRPSLDGSIISELRLDGKGGKSSADGGKGGSGSSKKDKQRRSKSPSSSSASNMKRNRHSRRGFLGLASRLKLTRKHESIAKLQLSILNSGFVSLKYIAMDRDLQTFLPKDRMTPKDFEERVKLMRKFEVLSTIEYRFASKYETYVCRHAQQESNQPKNNYKKCIPYDYNRVVLKTLPNVPDSDYINASHVDSYLKPNAYIAAQGPNEFTIEDFWRMVWEQKTFVIVMLTKVFDFIRVMCNQYWPVELNKPERYGNLEVTLLYEEPLADFVIRTIKLRKLKNSTSAAANQPVNAQNSATTTNTAAASSGVSQQVEENGQQGVTEKSKSEEQNPFVQIYRSSVVDGKHQRLDSKVYDSDDEEEDYTEEDTSISEEILLADENEDLAQRCCNSSSRGQSLPPVRSPKFVSTRSTRRRDRIESRSQSRLRTSSTGPQPTNSNRLSADQQTMTGGGGGVPSVMMDRRASSLSHHNQPGGDSNGGQKQPPNVFLHPLFVSAHLTGSTSSIPSMPNTPMTPRTPSSAGLDRSSATRKAVKKKRRARVKNQRPMRTQFMVPDEVIDDDDDDENNDATTDDELLNGGFTTDGDETAGTIAGGGQQQRTNERIIYQFHYNSWASHTSPFISSLLHFRRRVRICMDEMSKSGKTGPTIVHCNDGCGRTGTYLCIDANLELAEEDNVYDVFNYTKKMRQSRKFLIENLEQYKFVYDTIEEAMFCGKTWFPVSELHKRLKHKSQRNPITKKNEYLREYERITRMTSKFSIGDCAGGHRVENREKNRDVSTVPPDNFRPYLTSFQTNDSTDYINAVFVDGYTRSKEYIVTEWPLHKTISDFWSLIYDHDCNSVILLANPGESSTYPSFLPSEKELRRKFGPVFSAEMVSYTHYPNIKSWIYTINKKIVSLTEVIAGVKSEAKTTQVFQITCWPQGHRVPTSTNALVELMNMVERWRQRTAYGPVCVVSLNGKSRAGVYCAANVAIEQVVQHSEVDVFQAVKTVRRHRPQLIENMTEYKYCYDLILHYVLHYVNQNQANS